MTSDLSPNAVGILTEIINNDLNVSAESMAEFFGGDRRRYSAPLKELREAGYIETHLEKLPGRRPMTVSSVTDAGFQRIKFGSNWQKPTSAVPKMGVPKPVLLYPRYPGKFLSIHSDLGRIVSAPPKPDDEFVKFDLEVSPVGYDMFAPTSSPEQGEHVASFRERQSAQRAEYESKAKVEVAKRITHRRDKPRDLWTLSDIAYEFAGRTEDAWSIPPWRSDKKAFSGALKSLRAKYETNGEIECRMMDLFFESVSHDKFTDGDHVWLSFMKRFSQFVTPAKDSMMPSGPTDESRIRTAKALAELSADV